MPTTRTWRLTRSVLIAAPLGLVTSVAVAWTISLSPGPQNTSRTITFRRPIAGVPASPSGAPAGIEFSEQHHKSVFRTTIRTLDQQPVNENVVNEFRSLIVQQYEPLRLQANISPGELERNAWRPWFAFPSSAPAQLQSLTFRATGWPRRCLQSHAWIDTSGATVDRGIIRFLPPTPVRPSRTPDPHSGTIPLIPIWQGLAFNTAVFALPWCLIILGFEAVRSLRLARRHRRGHCPACNYDLLHNFTLGCPECGWNRPARNAAA